MRFSRSKVYLTMNTFLLELSEDAAESALVLWLLLPEEAISGRPATATGTLPPPTTP